MSRSYSFLAPVFHASRRAALALCGAALCAGTSVAARSPIAEILCAPTDQMTNRLSGQFASSRRATGLRSPEEIVEIWTDDAGEWTMVIAYANGKS